jgi:hypothetical protein
MIRSMSQRLLAVLRRPEMVTAVVSVRRRPFQLDSHDLPYAELSVPLAQTLETTCPWKDRDVNAWRALGKVPNMSKRAALAVIRILVATVADPSAKLDNLGDIDPANPPNDFRPYLCSPIHEQQVLDSLGELLDEVSKESNFPDWHWHRRQELSALPSGFRRLCLWTMHLSDWESLQAVLSAYDHLALEANPHLASAFARLLSLAGPARAVEWAGVLSLCSKDRRLRGAELIIESGVLSTSPTDEAAEAVAEEDDGSAFPRLQKLAEPA